MAIYHCHCKVISRGQGRSAVGAAAYRSGERITNDYDGITHDYTSKGGVVHSEIMLCENAPREYQNRSILWNDVERKEKGSKARLSREYEIALPVELSREEQIQLVHDYCRDTFVNNGMCVDFAIHDKEDGNPHAHIMLTTRPIEKDGSWGTKQKKEYILDKDGNKQYDKIKQTYKCRTIKINDWDSAEFLEKSRESWAAKLNQELEKKNIPQRVDHRSLKAQGKEQIPTEHLGVAALHMEKRGKVSDRGEKNRGIKQTNAQLQNILFMKKQASKAITFIREDMAWNNIHEKVASWESVLKRIAGDEKSLLVLQKNLEISYKQAQDMKPPKGESRTVQYDLRQIPYFEYHKNKLIADVADLQSRVKNSLAIVEQKRQEAQPSWTQDSPAVERLKKAVKRTAAEPERVATRTAEPLTVAPAFDVAAAARQLAGYRAVFIKAYEQTQGHTSYQENPVYRQQAVQIADIARRVQEQTASIKTLQAEKYSLGMFKGKEKKNLQEKIDNFSRLKRDNVAKLEALGVSDPAKADEAIKEKNTLAAAEQDKARAANQNVGAADRAEEAKAAYLEVARSVPDSFRQEVAEQIKQTTSTDPEGIRGSLAHFKAEAEAHRQLDGALKQEQGQERQRGQTRTQWEDR